MGDVIGEGLNEGDRWVKQRDEKLTVFSLNGNGTGSVPCRVSGEEKTRREWKRLQGFGWCRPDEIWTLDTWIWAQ